MFENSEIYEFCEQVQCVICLDTVESSEFQYIACCHNFHVQCIQSWFKVREICPVCMANNTPNVQEDETIYEFLEKIGCRICMDIEISVDFQHLSCGHSFHTICLSTRFQENKTCPTCMLNVSDASQGQDNEEMRCVICMDTEECVFNFTPCCHSFHDLCIQKWLKRDKSCPICKTPITDMHENANVDAYEDVDEDVVEDVDEDVAEDVEDDVAEDVEDDVAEDVEDDMADDVEEDVEEDEEENVEDVEEDVEDVEEDEEEDVEEDVAEDDEEDVNLDAYDDADGVDEIESMFEGEYLEYIKDEYEHEAECDAEDMFGDENVYENDYVYEDEDMFGEEYVDEYY